MTSHYLPFYSVRVFCTRVDVLHTRSSRLPLSHPVYRFIPPSTAGSLSRRPRPAAKAYASALALPGHPAESGLVVWCVVVWWCGGVVDVLVWSYGEVVTQ